MTSQTTHGSAGSLLSFLLSVKTLLNEFGLYFKQRLAVTSELYPGRTDHTAFLEAFRVN